MICLTQAEEKFAYDEKCSTAQRFDVSSMKCESCGVNQIATEDGRGCKCIAPAVRLDDPTVSYSKFQFTCSNMCQSSGRVASRDGTRCMSCGSSTIGIVGNDCRCAISTANTDPGRVLVEKDITGKYLTSKECVVCPNHGRVSSINPYECNLCTHANHTMDNTGTCTCNAGYTSAGSTCVLQSLASAVSSTINAGSQVTYRDIQSSDEDSKQVRTISSAMYQQYYLDAVINCGKYRSREACQNLANMCVLTKYDMTSTVCQQFQSIQDLTIATTHTYPNW